MRILTTRNGLAAFAALVGLAVLLVVGLPWIASTQIVRDRIAYELSLWSGYRVSLGAAPALDVWRGFRATLENVAFHDWNDDARQPVLEAERLEVSLSLLAALRGEVVLSGMSMHRPLLRLAGSGPVLELPSLPGGGRMRRAVDTAREIVAKNPASPDAGALPAIDFGTVEFFDGRIAGIDSDIVTGLGGRVVWPSLNRPVRLTANGIWHGQEIAIEASASAPLLLLAGGESTVGLSLKSRLVEAGFEGKANFSGDAYFEGPAKISSPSIRRLLEWSNTRLVPGEAIGAMSLTSQIQGNAKRLRLDQTKLTLGDNTGRGVLDLSFTDAVPAISGTLAFDRLDFYSFLAAFTPAVSGFGSLHDPIGTAFSEQLSLDLRLSSASGSFGAVTMSNVAASAQVKGDLTAFDISDATVFGGEVQAGLRIDGSEREKTVEARLMATNIDAGALAKAAGAARFLPQGRATLTVALKGTGDDWDEALSVAEGSAAASLGQGAIAGFDLARFRTLWEEGSFFPLSDTQGGSLPLRNIDFKARIADGVARIEKADIQLEQKMTISLAGVIHYLGQALALSGYFMPQDNTAAPTGENVSHEQVQMPFFVGGSWDDPFIAPATVETGFD